ncbi:MAG: acyl-CoA-binding protein [Deltaproteobacteria bacterium]|nr:MAG: acyl-CoA-binding protein [Deltaproteobacteria bacterium]
MGQKEFEEALERVKRLPEQPPQVLLELYGLYKQATEGDVSGKRPGMFDLRGRAKYDAWAARKGMSREQAMDEYVRVVERLLRQHGLDQD